VKRGGSPTVKQNKAKGENQKSEHYLPTSDFRPSRHLLVAAKTDIGNFKPALLRDFVLWNCEELYRK